MDRIILELPENLYTSTFRHFTRLNFGFTSSGVSEDTVAFENAPTITGQEAGTVDLSVTELTAAGDNNLETISLSPILSDRGFIRVAVITTKIQHSISHRRRISVIDGVDNFISQHIQLRNIIEGIGQGVAFGVEI